MESVHCQEAGGGQVLDEAVARVAILADRLVLALGRALVVVRIEAVIVHHAWPAHDDAASDSRAAASDSRTVNTDILAACAAGANDVSSWAEVGEQQ